MTLEDHPDYPDDWDDRRRRVYKRDNYTCQRCSATNREVHAHHLTPVDNGGSHALENLITLCKGCHERIHGFRFDTGESLNRAGDIVWEYKDTLPSEIIHGVDTDAAILAVRDVVSQTDETLLCAVGGFYRGEWTTGWVHGKTTDAQVEQVQEVLYNSDWEPGVYGEVEAPRGGQKYGNDDKTSTRKKSHPGSIQHAIARYEDGESAVDIWQETGVIPRDILLGADCQHTETEWDSGVVCAECGAILQEFSPEQRVV